MSSVLHRLRQIPFNRTFATLLLLVMSTQFLALEGYEKSFLKIGMMGVALIVFFLRVPYFSKAVFWGTLFWGVCFLCAFSQDYMRFSTLGYMGLFIGAYMAFYNLVHVGTFSFLQFKNLLRFILVAYSVVLLIQQLCILIGWNEVPFLNIMGRFKEWNRLPILSVEPSHTARIIVAAMLGYIRCLEMEKGNAKVSIRELFSVENRWIVIGYLWMTLTMGSGTGWIGLGILCLYFVRRRTWPYTMLIIIAAAFILKTTENKQFNRALVSFEALLSGNANSVKEADYSASVRIIPLINTIKYTDLSTREGWIGKGTAEQDAYLKNWDNITFKISIVDQYGLLGFIASLLFLFKCAIRRVVSLETVCFVGLLMCTIGNEYFNWSMIYIFTGVRYFQEEYSQVRRIVCFHLLNDYSGSPKVLKQVLVGMLERGYRVDLVSSRGGVLDELTSYKNLHMHSCAYRYSRCRVATMLRYGWAQLLSFLLSFRWLPKRDVVFFINTLLPVGPALAGRLMGKRVVYHYHENARAKGAPYRLLAAAMQLLASRIVCVSEYQVSFLRRKRGVVVVPNALPTEFVARLHPDADAAYERKTVLMLSSLKVYKGTREFMELAAKLPQYRFVMVISDTQANIDDYLQRNDLRVGANLNVYPSRQDVASFYNDASVVVCLTNPKLAIETFGLTALEAMTAGLPVIVPTVGGIAEMVVDGENGYKIDVQDLNSIAVRVDEMLSDRELYARLSDNALLFAKKYNADAMVDSVMEQLLKNDKSA